MENLSGVLDELKNLILENNPRLETIENASKELNIGVKNLRKLTYEDDFPVVKIGSKRLVVMSLLNEWFRDHKGEEFNI